MYTGRIWDAKVGILTEGSSIERGPRHSLAAWLLAICLAGEGVLAQTGAPKTPSATPTQTTWTVVWSDEFSGPANTPPDPSKWTYDIGGGGWGNNELETYTSAIENAHLDGNGHLVIQAVREPGGAYTSARLKTRGLFATTYGRIEARIKLPYGQGIWPAFWMLGANIDSVGWPQCGEIDIMENAGNEPSVNHGSVHGPGYSGTNARTASYSLPNGQKFSDDSHTFAIEWSSQAVTLSVDGNSYQTVARSTIPSGAQWVFDSPFFLLLNVAVGGNFPGSPNTTTTFPQQMIVDYVRVYQPAGAPLISAGGLVNAASYGPLVAPGSLASLFGSALADSSTASLFDSGRNAFQTSGGGAVVTVNGTPSPLTYVSPGQINFQIPWEAAAGRPMTVQVMRDGIPGNTVTTLLGATAPSAFQANGKTIVTCAGGEVRAGAACTLWGNGFGPTSPHGKNGTPAGAIPLAVAVNDCELTIGGVQAVVLYCGAAPGLLIDQLNFIYPEGVSASGATAAATLTIGGVGAGLAVPVSAAPAVNPAPVSPMEASQTALRDEFSADSALDTFLWSSSTPFLVALARNVGPAPGSSYVPPSLIFSEAGMGMSGVNGSYQLAGIQSNASFRPPFTIQATVKALQANGAAFELYAIGGTLRQYVSVAGNLNSTSMGVGVFRALNGNGTNIYFSGAPNTWYTITVSFDASGNVSVILQDASGNTIGGVDAFSVGTDPFYLVLAQREGLSDPAGPNVAIWRSVAVTAPPASVVPGPVVTAVTPVMAQNNQAVVITGRGFGNTPPQTIDLGDGSINTIACDAAAPSLVMQDYGTGPAGWTAGLAACDGSDLIGVKLGYWSDTWIVLNGFGSALGNAQSPARWNLAPYDPLMLQVFGPRGAAAAIFNMSAAPPLPVAAMGATSITISPTQQWTGTGIKANTGDIITISAGGSVMVAKDGHIPPLSPAGFPPDCAAASAVYGPLGLPSPVPRLPCYSLLGRIGQSGTPFEVGTHTTILSPAAGELFLGINDNNLSNNSGSWTASIAIRPGSSR